MENKNTKLPNNFFSKSRPTVTNKETFKDVVPIEWSKDVTSKKQNAKVYSTKEKKFL